MKPLTELQSLLINDLGALPDQMAAFPSVLTATTVANSATRLDEFQSLT